MTQVDQTWQDVILKSIGPDGLYYFPIQGKPWYGKELWWAHAIARSNGTLFTVEKPDPKRLKDLDTYATAGANSLIEESGITQFAHPQSDGRITKVLAIYAMRDGNPLLERDDAADGRPLGRVGDQEGRLRLLPGLPLSNPTPGSTPRTPRPPMPAGTEGGEINGRFIRACAIEYKLTGDKKALELARLLTNFMRYHDGNYWGPNGEFAGDRHFHSHTNYLIGMLEYADAAKDKELLEFCRKSFEWAKSPASGFGPVTGFSPEFADVNYATSEGCAVGDMEVLACNLSAFGAGDYYEDAERWARNYFSEIQLTAGQGRQPGPPRPDDAAQETALQRMHDTSPSATWGPSPVGPRATNGGAAPTENLLMQCCTGNCTRALWFLWRHSPGLQGRRVEGQHAAQPRFALGRRLQLHPLPGPRRDQGAPDLQECAGACAGVDRHRQQRNHRAGQRPAAAFHWQARYLNLGEVKAGEQIVIRMPDRRTDGQGEDGPGDLHAAGAWQHGRLDRSARPHLSALPA